MKSLKHCKRANISGIVTITIMIVFLAVIAVLSMILFCVIATLWAKHLFQEIVFNSVVVIYQQNFKLIVWSSSCNIVVGRQLIFANKTEK